MVRVIFLVHLKRVGFGIGSELAAWKEEMRKAAVAIMQPQAPWAKGSQGKPQPGTHTASLNHFIFSCSGTASGQSTLGSRKDKVSPRTVHPAQHHTGTKPGIPKAGCWEAVPRGTQGPRAQPGQGSAPPESSRAKVHCCGQQEREQAERQLCSPQHQWNICSGESVEAKTRSMRPE